MDAFPILLLEGLPRQYDKKYEWNVARGGHNFVVQFPSLEKLEMLRGFEEFKLKCSNAYIKVDNAANVVEQVG